MRLFVLPVAATVLLTACATPREACISAANREGRVVDRLVTETRANINRGFALAERQDVRVVDATCEGESEDGTKFRFECEETRTITVQEPVAIDLDAERAKLASLLARQRENRAAAQSAVQQCIAAHPE
jgi:hypothetical protein